MDGLFTIGKQILVRSSTVLKIGPLMTRVCIKVRIKETFNHQVETILIADAILVTVGFYIGDEKVNSGRLPFAFVGAIAAVIMIVSEVTKKPKKICEDANVLAQIYIVLTITIFNRWWRGSRSQAL